MRPYPDDALDDEDDVFDGHRSGSRPFGFRSRALSGSGEGALLEGGPGARMRDYLIERFGAISDALLERLAEADGHAPTHPSIAVLCACAGLDEVEGRLLDFVEKKDSVAHFQIFPRETDLEATREHYACLAVALDVRADEVQARLYRHGSLSRLDLAKKTGGRSDLEDFVQASDLLEYILALEPSTSEALLAAVVEPAAALECPIDAFPHLALFGGRPRAGKDKGWMNRLLEDNPLPAIWITNDIECMNPAFLRRFLLPVAFSTPLRRVRRQMVERHLGDTPERAALLDELAADPALVPAHFGAARRLLELCADHPPETLVREGVAAARRVLHGGAGPRLRQPATAFDVAYLNLAGGIAPGHLGQAPARRGRGSLYFFGPPGTGKTAFAQVLADALDRELVVTASSDLVSPYVGETERNIARLFVEIDTEHSVLFLDEIDSLLRDRHQAHHSWEATQVNELLQQMERFDGIFIAATNLNGQLDAAAMRRFDFKLQFRALDRMQRRSLFAREALGDVQRVGDIPPALVARLDGLDMLTPGDFANVVRQGALLGETLAPEDFLRRLIVECRYKEGMQAVA